MKIKIFSAYLIVLSIHAVMQSAATSSTAPRPPIRLGGGTAATNAATAGGGMFANMANGFVLNMFNGITQENINNGVRMVGDATPHLGPGVGQFIGDLGTNTGNAVSNMAPGIVRLIQGIGAPARDEMGSVIRGVGTDARTEMGAMANAVDRNLGVVDAATVRTVNNVGREIRQQANGLIADATGILRERALTSVGGLAVIGIGFIGGSYAAYKTVKNFLYEPTLIEKKSSHIARWFRKPTPITNHMVISDTLKNDINYITSMTANIKKNGGTYENILMYGPPGTGKTLFGKLLAQNSGMNFAFVPAANISQFLAKGTVVQELNNLFAWAEKQRNGTIIFFDEIETFIAKRATLSAEAQHALGLLLAKTGTPSSKIAIVGATNRPEIIDEAAQSRFGLKVEFGLPDVNAIQAQLEMNIQEVFKLDAPHQPGSCNTAIYDILCPVPTTKKSSQHLLTYDRQLNYDYLKNNTHAIAQQLVGFSGRELQQLVNRVRQIALAQNKFIVDADIVNDIIKKMRDNKAKFPTAK